MSSREIFEISIILPNGESLKSKDEFEEIVLNTRDECIEKLLEQVKFWLYSNVQVSQWPVAKGFDERQVLNCSVAIMRPDEYENDLLKARHLGLTQAQEQIKEMIDYGKGNDA
jgi:hypothetical protein